MPGLARRWPKRPAYLAHIERLPRLRAWIVKAPFLFPGNEPGDGPLGARHFVSFVLKPRVERPLGPPVYIVGVTGLAPTHSQDDETFLLDAVHQPHVRPRVPVG